jgi:hypothetical protein
VKQRRVVFQKCKVEELFMLKDLPHHKEYVEENMHVIVMLQTVLEDP